MAKPCCGVTTTAVPGSRIQRVDVHSVLLEVPLRDFEHLPRRLGCSLHRSKRALALSSNQPGCELHFQVAGDMAVLFHVALEDDAQGRFLRTVLGTLLATYRGELEATVTWDGEAEESPRLIVRSGETSHPLLSGRAGAEPQEHPAPLASSVEHHLADARAAWLAYQQSKPGT